MRCGMQLIYNPYHLLLCCDGLTRNLIKAELCDGMFYGSDEADKFMESVFQEYLERGIKTYLRYEII